MWVTKTVILVATCVIAWPHTAVQAESVGNTITYQGQLKESGIPVNGMFDFEFKLWNAPSGGETVGWTVAIRAFEVLNGLFTVPLDFGPGVFTGEARWLEVGVRPNGSSDNYTVLAPRQELTAAPYALYALAGPGGGGGYWSLTGDDIYNSNSGKVGRTY